MRRIVRVDHDQILITDNPYVTCATMHKKCTTFVSTIDRTSFLSWPKTGILENPDLKIMAKVASVNRLEAGSMKACSI